MSFLSKIFCRRNHDMSPLRSNHLWSDTHLKAAGEFKWDRANATDVAYSYDDGVLSAFAIGKENWMTVMTAMCVLYENHCGRGFKTLRNAIGDKAWVQSEDPRIQSWLSANKKCFSDLPRFIPESPVVTLDERVGRFAHPRALEYPAYRMANIYIGAWQRRYPPVMDELLIIADGIGGDYWDHPEIEAALVASKRAFEVTRDFALEWFEARGFEVNKVDHLVRLEGYQPLYMIHEIEL